MVKFDSFYNINIGGVISIGGYEQICTERPVFPTFKREHRIEDMYSKEFNYLKEVSEYQAGWDSYAGKIPDKQSVQCSISLLSAFTRELKESRIFSDLPEFCLAPDGVLGFEWDYAQNANLFARIYSPNKIEIHYNRK